MKTVLDIGSERHFPCPLCGEGQKVRTSKKDKPYLVCYGCGVQMFVRAEPGIRRLDELIKSAKFEKFWTRLAELEERYKKTCPKCGKSFWIEEKLRELGWWHELVGYRCPESGCEGIAEVKKQ
jgi:predicted RNA-binding Zn-ribbon protein involved in translation (DUF1610 family)